jgi:hypothetical protein
MKPKKLLHLANCLIDPSDHLDEVTSVFVPGSPLHRQTCIALWAEMWREEMTPQALVACMDG